MILLRIAARNLLRTPSRTVLAASAVAVALWVIIAVHSFIESTHAALLYNLTHGEVGFLQIHKKDYLKNADAKALRYTFADTPELRAKIKAVAGVTGLTPRLVFGGALTMPGEKGLEAQFLIFGVEPGTLPSVMPLPVKQIMQGRMLAAADSAEIVFHRSIADNLKLDLKAVAADPSPEKTPALVTFDGDGVMHGKLVTPVGTYQDIFAGERPFAMLPLVTAQNLLGLEGKVTEYTLDIADPDAIKRVQADLASQLGDGYEVFRWDEKVPLIKQNFQIEDVGFTIGVIIFFIVSALGSINTMMMTVMERTREIGTMMAVGMSGRQIIALFITEGVLIAALAAVFGLGIGTLTVLFFHQHGVSLTTGSGSSALPLKILMEVEPLYMVKCAIFALCGLAVASLLPARRAANMSPVEALQST